MSNSNKPGRPVSATSASTKVHAFYAGLPANLSSKEIVDRIVAEFNVKRGTAQVYLHKCRKALGLTTLRPRAEKGTSDAPAASTDTATASDSDSSESASSEDTVSVAEGNDTDTPAENEAPVAQAA